MYFSLDNMLILAYNIISKRETTTKLVKEERKMKWTDIMCYAPINDTDPEKVREIAESIKANGWQGAPILVVEGHGQLVTGSHRMAALNLIQDETWMDLDELGEIAETVDDIVEAWCEENDASLDELPYDNLEAVFAGTWVEEYKNEIVEW